MTNQVYTFHLLGGLPYILRVLIAFLLITLGLYVQLFKLLPNYIGYIFLAAGTSLLLIKGFDKRVKFPKFNPNRAWTDVDPSKFVDVIKMQEKMDKWDFSLVDVTSTAGKVMLCLMFGVPLYIYIKFGIYGSDNNYVLYFVDIVILVIPHYITGLKHVSTLVTPTLKKKIETLKTAKKMLKYFGDDVIVQYKMELIDEKYPQDVRLKINFRGHHEDFIGIQFQVSTNEVKNTIHPYFYVVLIAKRGFGLKKYEQTYSNSTNEKGVFAFFKGGPPPLIGEFDIKKDVEILVLRQETTKTTGFSTTSSDINRIIKKAVKIYDKFSDN